MSMPDAAPAPKAAPTVVLEATAAPKAAAQAAPAETQTNTKQLSVFGRFEAAVESVVAEVESLLAPVVTKVESVVEPVVAAVEPVVEPVVEKKKKKGEQNRISMRMQK